MPLFFYIHIPIILLLGVSAFIDYKYKILPIYSYIVLTIYYSVISLNFGNFDFKNSLLAALISFVAFGLMAWKGNGGIGDIFMMSGLSFCLGLPNSLYLIIYSSLFYLLFFVYEWLKEITQHRRKNKRFDFVSFYKKERPFAPSVLCGYLCIVTTLFLQIVVFGG